MLTADNYAFHLEGLCDKESRNATLIDQNLFNNFYVTQVIDHPALAVMPDCIYHTRRDDWLQNAVFGVNPPDEQVLKDWFADDTDVIRQMIEEGIIDIAAPEEATAGVSTTTSVSPASIIEKMDPLAYTWTTPPEGILSRESVEAAMALATTTEADAGLPDNRMFNAALKKQAYKIQNNGFSGAFPNPSIMEKHEAVVKESDVDISDITASVIKRFNG